MIEFVRYPAGSLPDERLTRRANAILATMTERSGLPFCSTFEHRKEIQGAYRLVENDRLSFDLMLKPLAEELAAHLRAGGAPTLLCVSDTTEIDFSRLRKARGYGTICNPICRGEFLHSALMVSTEGILGGPLAARTWVRDPEEQGKAATRKQRKPSEKESFRWWEIIDEAERRLNAPGRLLHVADREADIYDLFARCGPVGYRLLIRAAQDRTVDAETRRLWATCVSWPAVSGQRVVKIADREAVLTLRYGTVDLLAPVRSGGNGHLTMNAVLVREESPPATAKPVEWLLLTTEAVDDADDGWRCVDYYRRRWIIEEFHKTLKSGCKIEEREYEERDHFDVALPLYMTVASRIVRLKQLAKVEPEAPARTEFTSTELTVLCKGDAQQGAALSLLAAILKVGRLGGHMPSRAQPNPGWLTLWRGLFRLVERVEGFELRYDLCGGGP